MEDPAESFAAFLLGIMVTLTVLGVACTPSHVAVKAHTKAALGCMVISEQEAAAGLVGLPNDAVYWRCKDGKVYVR